MKAVAKAVEEAVVEEEAEEVAREKAVHGPDAQQCEHRVVFCVSWSV